MSKTPKTMNTLPSGLQGDMPEGELPSDIPLEIREVKADVPNEGPAVSPKANSGSLKFTVRTLTGQVIPVEMPQNNPDMVLNVGDVKKRIELTQGISALDQRLVFNGKELADNLTLAEADIQEGVNLHLFLRTKPTNDPKPAVNQPLTPIMAMADPRLQPPMMPMGVSIGPDGSPTPPINAVAAGSPAVLGIQGVAMAPAPAPVVLSDADVARLKETDQLSKLVQMFSVIDAVFLAIWAIAAPILFALLPLCVAGYFGARRYQRWLAGLYVLYLFAAFALRIWWMTLLSVLYIVLLSISALIELFIIYNVIQFLRLVWRLKADEIQILFLWRALSSQAQQA